MARKVIRMMSVNISGVDVGHAHLASREGAIDKLPTAQFKGQSGEKCEHSHQNGGDEQVN